MKHGVVQLKVNAWSIEAIGFFNPEDENSAELIWIPISQIRNKDDLEWREANVVLEIEIPEWLLTKTGLDRYAEEVD